MIFVNAGNVMLWLSLPGSQTAAAVRRDKGIFGNGLVKQVQPTSNAGNVGFLSEPNKNHNPELVRKDNKDMHGRNFDIGVKTFQ